MKKMKVEEGTDNLQEIYIVLSRKICEKFFLPKRGEYVRLKARKYIFLDFSREGSAIDFSGPKIFQQTSLLFWWF